MFPDSLAAPRLGDGSRVTEAHLDVPLYWQCWKLDDPLVEAITDAVWLAAADLGVRNSLPHTRREKLSPSGVSLL